MRIPWLLRFSGVVILSPRALVAVCEIQCKKFDTLQAQPTKVRIHFGKRLLVRNHIFHYLNYQHVTNKSNRRNDGTDIRDIASSCSESLVPSMNTVCGKTTRKLLLGAISLNITVECIRSVRKAV
jgi:hypothetical protein